MADEDVFQRLMAKQAELERMRRAIQELNTLEDVEEEKPAPEPEPAPAAAEEGDELDGDELDEQKTLIATLMQKRDELLRMQVRRTAGLAFHKHANVAHRCLPRGARGAVPRSK